MFLFLCFFVFVIFFFFFFVFFFFFFSSRRRHTRCGRDWSSDVCSSDLASAWMHIAYTGPVILNIDDEGYPVQPYGVKDNPNSILDVADIVFVDPVNTGYSRMVADKDGKLPDRKTFFGINADIKYLAEWMNTFVTRHNRWESPKYLIGESYGGPRVMGLSKELQNNQWMYLNGVILVSPADYKIYSTNQPIYSALNLPYFTAAAWHQKALPASL